MIVYPVEIDDTASSTTLAKCPDVPGAISGGLTVAEALAGLPSALLQALIALHEQGRPMPLPGTVGEGQPALYAPIIWHG